MTEHHTPKMTDDTDAPTAADDYDLGERVADSETPPHEREPMRVVAHLGAPADEVELPSGETVADVNPNHPPDAPTVTTVYEPYLDHNIGTERWNAWIADDPDAFLDRLETHTNEWGIPLRTYAYPATRLDPWATAETPEADE